MVSLMLFGGQILLLLGNYMVSIYLTRLACFTIKVLGHLGGSVNEASAFGSGRDPRFLGQSLTSGSLLSGEPAAPSPPAILPAFALFLYQINK